MKWLWAGVRRSCCKDQINIADVKVFGELAPWHRTCSKTTISMVLILFLPLVATETIGAVALALAWQHGSKANNSGLSTLRVAVFRLAVGASSEGEPLG